MDILRSLQEEVDKLKNNDRLRSIQLTEVKQELQRVKTIALGKLDLSSIKPDYERPLALINFNRSVLICYVNYLTHVKATFGATLRILK